MKCLNMYEINYIAICKTFCKLTKINIHILWNYMVHIKELHHNFLWSIWWMMDETGGDTVNVTDIKTSTWNQFVWIPCNLSKHYIYLFTMYRCFIHWTAIEIVCLYVSLTKNICIILQNKILNCITSQFLSLYSVQILRFDLLCMIETIFYCKNISNYYCFHSNI